MCLGPTSLESTSTVHRRCSRAASRERNRRQQFPARRIHATTSPSLLWTSKPEAAQPLVHKPFAVSDHCCLFDSPSAVTNTPHRHRPAQGNATEGKGRQTHGEQAIRARSAHTGDTLEFPRMHLHPPARHEQEPVAGVPAVPVAAPAHSQSCAGASPCADHSRLRLAVRPR